MATSIIVRHSDSRNPKLPFELSGFPTKKQCHVCRKNFVVDLFRFFCATNFRDEKISVLESIWHPLTFYFFYMLRFLSNKKSVITRAESRTYEISAVARELCGCGDADWRHICRTLDELHRNIRQQKTLRVWLMNFDETRRDAFSLPFIHLCLSPKKTSRHKEFEC